VPSWNDTAVSPPIKLIDALRKAHQRGTRIVSFCLGSFVLAAAGLLDGRRATTHWGWSNELAARYPDIDVAPDVLYVTKATVTWPDVRQPWCCLHLIRKQHGAEVANSLHDAWSYRLSGRAAKRNSSSSRIQFRYAGSIVWVMIDDADLDVAHSLDGWLNALMSRRTF
jgi:transcriptional regulator GlxA family with amidase domain